MLTKLQQVANEGTVRISHVYLAHLKKDEERKLLAHADALPWEEVPAAVRAVFEQHLYQAIDGTLGEVNFPCMYTGEVLSVAKVASADFDRTQNRPSVEVLEAVRDLREVTPQALVALGNVLAYKVLAAGTIANHLLGLLKFSVVPELGAAPIHFSYATICDLDDREESFFDELKGTFVTQELHNVIKRGSVSRAVFFPCLDDEGREMADLLVYAGSGAGSWFKALEATRRFSPRREGQALVRMITEQASGEVPHDLFRQMGEQLLPVAAEGLPAESVAESIEKAVGHGIDRLGFLARWESAFGGPDYRPAYDTLFASHDLDKPMKLRMQAGDIQISLAPSDLEHFRQVTVGRQTFMIFAVPERAKVVVGKDLDLKIKPVSIDHLRHWMEDEAK